MTQHDAECELRVADALRAQWRLFERVSVRRCGDGEGFVATTWLNATLVRGMAEQRCVNPSSATAAGLDARRLDAINACIERLNKTLPPEESIRGFVVRG
ncbi:MAG: hypothetical protein R2725_07420 [Solirubrobacterales bacterium]